MLNDSKHTEALKLWLTERELVDLMRLAAAQDRKPGEMARVALRQFMYGMVRGCCEPDNEANRGE